MLRESWGYRGADEARGVADHEGHLLGRHVRGGYNEIAFILARQVVEDDYEWITRELMAVARQYSDDRIVSMLEGGYNFAALGRSAVAHVRALADGRGAGSRDRAS